MRKIKFRQWNYRNKTWHYFEFKDGCVEGVINASLSLYPIYQFTGLHDKNGKEIYEGDIVIAPIIDGCTACLEKIIITDITRLYDNQSVQYKRSEVIGNIHENKELL